MIAETLAKRGAKVTRAGDACDYWPRAAFVGDNPRKIQAMFKGGKDAEEREFRRRQKYLRRKAMSIESTAVEAATGEARLSRPNER